MEENKTVNSTGIDETVIFQRLWRKKIFIFIVTGSCFILGIISISFRPKIYTVNQQIIFEPKEFYEMEKIFKYGSIDFDFYAKTGKIEKSDSLRFSPDEQTLLKKFRDKITFKVNYSQRNIIISGNTTDTLQFMNELNVIGLMLQKTMNSLINKYTQKTIDSLDIEQKTIEDTLKINLRKLLEMEEKYPNPQDSEMKMKWAKYEYASVYSLEFGKILKLREYKGQLRKMEVVLNSPQIELIEKQLDKRSLLIRWLFFGFAGSCIWILGSYQVALLLKKKKD